MRMKKTITFLVASSFVVAVHAQNEEQYSNIDWNEDSTEVVSIQDIINEQQQVTAHNMAENHFTDVWSRKSYNNLSFCTTKFTPDGEIRSGLGNDELTKFSSKWGVSFQSGRSYRLHPNPIANIVQFYCDYTWIDATVNYFEKESKGDFAYDSSLQSDDEGHYFMPWNLKKYELGFGMSLGPSITVCPFNYLDVQQLHYLKVNLYYHIGYHASAFLILDDDSADKNQDTNNSTDDGKRHKQLKDNQKGGWGHGMMSSIGFSITWKGIGFGYEHLSSKLKYKPLSSSDFGSKEDKFSVSRNRVFIQFRM